MSEAMIIEPDHSVRRAFEPSASWGPPDARLLNGGPRKAPDLPVECFGSLGGLITDLAASKGSPVDYVAIPMLGMAAGVIGDARAVRLRENWVEPCVLWVAPVGGPGTAKTPPLTALKRAVLTIERECAGDLAERQRRYETDKAEAAAIGEKWARDLKAAVDKGNSAPLKPEAADEPDAPRAPRFIVADITTEKLARIIADNPRGVLSVRDELAGLIGNFGKYGGEDAPFYLSAYSGDFSPVDRVKGGTISAPRACLSIVGAIQPDKLQGLLAGRANDGLVSRFLVVWPDVPRAEWKVPNVDEGRLVAIFRRLRSLEMDRDNAGDPVPRVLPLTPEAEAIYSAWWSAQSDRCAAAGGFMAEFLAKSRGTCARVALVLELLEWAAGMNGPVEGPTCVSARSVARACQLFEDYLEPMARRVYADAALPEPERNAVSLLKEIRARKARQFKAREARREWGVQGLSESADMDAACEVLIDGNCIREIERVASGPGRKAKAYIVNPHLFTGGPS